LAKSKSNGNKGYRILKQITHMGISIMLKS